MVDTGCCTTISSLVTVFYFVVGANAIYSNRMRYNEYDYIIVGAGSTGSVVASRLSEDPSNRILLLEAGGLPDDVSEVPLFAPYSIGGDMDWAYYSQPEEEASLALKGRRNYLPRGKSLGGSSILNYMIYIRGPQRDFDEWEKGGASGWAWKDVFPYFLKSQEQTDEELLTNGYHASNGPLTVSSYKFETPVRKAFLEAGEFLGYKALKDLNAQSAFGFATPQTTTRNGLRCSTEKAFLRPAAHRVNLDILTHAHVTKVNFDQSNRAISVSFDQKNSSVEVAVLKEIILSAGAISSPQILMLSGIGPKKHLQQLKIPVVSDLPVGKNLQDHVMAGGLIYAVNNSSGLSQLRNLSREAIAALIGGNGPLTVPGFMEGVSFVNTKYQAPSEKWPDLMISLFGALVLPWEYDKYSELAEKYKEKDVVTLYPSLARPKSRGVLKLRSTNPYDHPLIYGHLLEEEEDLKTLVDGMKIVEAIMQSPPFLRFEAARIHLDNVGCDHVQVDTEDYLLCLARALTTVMYHKSGTCKMAARLDQSGVLDPELRVKGVRSLRVADLSIMPRITSGNPHAACVMIGEKLADMIKKQNSDKDEL